MRRGFREWSRSLPAFERLQIIDLVNIEFKNDLKTLVNLISLCDLDDKFASQASSLFRNLVKFESDYPSSVSQQDLQVALQEFSLYGQPYSVDWITGACFHDFLDQLIQATIASVFDADVPRPERVGYKHQFYDFYLDTFEECWYHYKPIFRDIKERVDLSLIYANLLSEYAKSWEPLKSQSEAHADIELKNSLFAPIQVSHRRHNDALDTLKEALAVFREALQQDANTRLPPTGWKVDPLGMCLSHVQEFYRVEPPKPFRAAIDNLSFAPQAETVLRTINDFYAWIAAEKDRLHEEPVFSYQLTSQDFAANTSETQNSQADSYLSLDFDSDNRSVTMNSRTVRVPGDSQWSLLRSMYKAGSIGLTILELEEHGFNKGSVYRTKNRLNEKLGMLRIGIEVDNRGLWQLVNY